MLQTNIQRNTSDAISCIQSGFISYPFDGEQTKLEHNKCEDTEWHITKPCYRSNDNDNNNSKRSRSTNNKCKRFVINRGENNKQQQTTTASWCEFIASVSDAYNWHNLYFGCVYYSNFRSISITQHHPSHCFGSGNCVITIVDSIHGTDPEMVPERVSFSLR